MEFDMPKREASIIKVLGVGGGGSNAVTSMFNQGIEGVDFAICNTDEQALKTSKVPIKIQLGPELTEGRGAGSKPEVGRQACLESLDDIKEFLEDNTKMLFVTAGMGGGTGTGAAPLIAKASRDLDILTVGIVTLPFTFEGLRRTKQGHTGLEELRKNVDTLIIISNDKLRQIHGDMSLTEAFLEADSILTTAAKGIAEIITVPGYVNVDFEDVNTVMRDSGVAIMGTAEASGEDRARKAVDAALNSPLLEDNEIKGAQHILLNITSGSSEVTMDEIFEITEFVQEEAGFGTDLIWGNCFDENLDDKLSVTIIATGFESSQSRKEQTEGDKVVVTLDEEERQENPFDYGRNEGEKPNVVEFDRPSVLRGSNPKYSYREPYLKEEDKEKMETYEKERQQREEALKEKFRNRANQIKLSNPQNVMDLENQPAYLRRQVALNNTTKSKDAEISRWTIEGGDEPEVNTKNSFLHDNVD